MTRQCIATILLVLGTASAAHAMELASPGVQSGSTLPEAQINSDCGGGNVPPTLSWTGAPKDTKSFAVTLFDPDAHGGWWHWIVYDIPSNVERLGPGAEMPADARIGRNDYGATAYGGACPPPGSGVHHYRFTVWALPIATIPVADPSGETIGPYLEAHALAHATLIATYER